MGLILFLKPLANNNQKIFIRDHTATKYQYICAAINKQDGCLKCCLIRK